MCPLRHFVMNKVSTTLGPDLSLSQINPLLALMRASKVIFDVDFPHLLFINRVIPVLCL